MNHNFADLNSVMWTAIELETDRSKLINHYFPIPEQYTSEEAFVSLILTRRTSVSFVQNQHHIFNFVSATFLSKCLLILFLFLAVLSYFRGAGTF